MKAPETINKAEIITPESQSLCSQPSSDALGAIQARSLLDLLDVYGQALLSMTLELLPDTTAEDASGDVREISSTEFSSILSQKEEEDDDDEQLSTNDGLSDHFQGRKMMAFSYAHLSTNFLQLTESPPILSTTNDRPFFCLVRSFWCSLTRYVLFELDEDPDDVGKVIGTDLLYRLTQCQTCPLGYNGRTHQGEESEFVEEEELVTLVTVMFRLLAGQTKDDWTEGGKHKLASFLSKEGQGAKLRRVLFTAILLLSRSQQEWGLEHSNESLLSRILELSGLGDEVDDASVLGNDPWHDVLDHDPWADYVFERLGDA